MLERAKARFVRVIEQIDQDEHGNAYRQAWSVPLAFYLESDERCLGMLLSGEARAKGEEIMESFRNHFRRMDAIMPEIM